MRGSSPPRRQRRAAGEEVVERAAQGVDVGALVDRLAPRLLGRDVVGGPDGQPVGQRGRAGGAAPAARPQPGGGGRRRGPGTPRPSPLPPGRATSWAARSLAERAGRRRGLRRNPSMTISRGAAYSAEHVFFATLTA